MKKKKKKKSKIKKFIDFVLGDDKSVMGHEFNPKIGRKLRAYSLRSKHPIGNGKYYEYLVHMTEWDNGEGFDFSINMDSNEKMFTLHHDEIELILKGLDKMNYFDFKKDELRDE